MTRAAHRASATAPSAAWSSPTTSASTVEAGERHVIIGPNGAGKTSLINQIGGQLRPDAGRIYLKGRDITGWPPDRIARARHRPHVPAQQSVPEPERCENICGSRSRSQRGNPLDFLTPARRNARVVAHAEELLAQVHLDGDGARPVRNLSYGEQRQLEIGMALAGDPELLLLDEPTSGMSPAETERMIALICAPAAQRSPILMIEHDMNVVFTRRRPHHRASITARCWRRGTPAEIQAEQPRPRSLSRHGARDALMLELDNVNAYYGDSHVLRGVSLTVAEGEVVCLLGRNGAGKTTTILTTMGYLKPRPGRITYRGRDIAALPPYAIARLGVGFVPQERGIFPSLTVLENLTVFARGGGRAAAGRCRASSSCFRCCARARAISASSSPAASSRCCRSRGR